MTTRPCPCGGWMVPSYRIDRLRTIDTLCCFSCGEETPQKYTRTALQRNGDSRPVVLTCARCRIAFNVPTSDADQKFCSRDCAWASSPNLRRGGVAV